MDKKRVLVTGSAGLVGNALKREAINYPNYDFYFTTRDDADLTSDHQVRSLFLRYQPNFVISTAAQVGGIGGNNDLHEKFFYENTLMNAHIIHTSIEHKVEKLFVFSSVCVFPDNLSLLEEEKIHDGKIFEGNFAYGHAKRNISIHIDAAKKQYGIKNYTAIILGNIFGSNDNYSLKYGHIIPSLIHRLYLSIQNNTDFIVWGDGKSLREFIYVDDTAKVILNLLNKDNLPDKIIISGRREYTIKEIVDMLVQISGFKGQVVWDTSKPNGQRSRPTSKKIIDSLLPDFQYSDIYESLTKTWQWFCKNYPNVRTEYK